jgi:aryl-alcohol dehydrogenase-like predicted oxidoreductase
MQYVRLGRTGLKVSRICLGCMSFGNQKEWMLEIDKARPILERAFELGINFFDTANTYSMGRSEEILGEVFKHCRSDVVIATKVWGKWVKGQMIVGYQDYI